MTTPRLGSRMHAQQHTDDDQSESVEYLEEILADLCARAGRLLEELKLFQSKQEKNGRQRTSEVRIFLRAVEAEAKSLHNINKKLKDETENNGTVSTNDVQHHRVHIHALKSSNIPFYEGVWKAAKSNRNVVAISKKYHLEPTLTRSAQSRSDGEERSKTAKHNVVVDVVAEGGLKWIKLSTINNRRLLFEIAKEGWEAYGDYSSDSENDMLDTPTPLSSQERHQKLELVKMAENLRDAARLRRVNHHHPSLHIILPNVQEYVDDDVDAILDDIRKIGATVECSLDMRPALVSDTGRSNIDEVILDRMLPLAASDVLTPDINVDCTVLLALVSDISHISKDKLPLKPENRAGSYHEAILRQVETEANDALLSNELYPVLAGRKLLTVPDAVQRMYEIVSTMGTDDERIRADIFCGRGQFEGMSSDVLRNRLKDVSCHDVPSDLMLPIIIVEFDDSVDSGTVLADIGISSTQEQHGVSKLDKLIARRLEDKMKLSKINRSVFLYGWMNDIATITSNKIVATNINKVINELLDEHEGIHVPPRKYNRKILRQSDDNVKLGEGMEKIKLDDKFQEQQQEQQMKHEIQQEDVESPTSTLITEKDISTFKGPKIYICETARSLVGKEKRAPSSTKIED